MRIRGILLGFPYHLAPLGNPILVFQLLGTDDDPLERGAVGKHVIRYVTFSMFIRIQSARVDVDIWVEFLDGDAESPCQVRKQLFDFINPQIQIVGLHHPGFEVRT